MLVGCDVSDRLPPYSVATLAHRGPRVGWALSLCVEAGEAGGSFRSTLQPSRVGYVHGPAADPIRAGEEAARRARSKTRRYCAANGLNRLGTLTYAGEGCHDPKALRADVAAFFRNLRTLLGGASFAYLWTAEWHPGGHGLHVHFAVGQFIKRGLIDQAWQHGYVHIKLLGDLPVGSGAVAQARKAAGYLSKYVGKGFDAKRLPGLHRYEVAEGFQPEITAVWANTRAEVIDAACGIMRNRPDTVWLSDTKQDWQGPPAVWLQWPG